jgi:hypothetical protein
MIEARRLVFGMLALHTLLHAKTQRCFLMAKTGIEHQALASVVQNRIETPKRAGKRLVIGILTNRRALKARRQTFPKSL